MKRSIRIHKALCVLVLLPALITHGAARMHSRPETHPAYQGRADINAIIQTVHTIDPHACINTDFTNLKIIVFNIENRETIAAIKTAVLANHEQYIHFKPAQRLPSSSQQNRLEIPLAPVSEDTPVEPIPSRPNPNQPCTTDRLDHLDLFITPPVTWQFNIATKNLLLAQLGITGAQDINAMAYALKMEIPTAQFQIEMHAQPTIIITHIPHGAITNEVSAFQILLAEQYTTWVPNTIGLTPGTTGSNGNPAAELHITVKPSIEAERYRMPSMRVHPGYEQAFLHRNAQQGGPSPWRRCLAACIRCCLGMSVTNQMEVDSPMDRP